MTKNVHPIERAARVIVGIGLLSLTVIGPQTMWGLIGIVPLLTGIIGWCPPYQLLGISTCKVEQKPAS
jgi:hypothetical protein